MTITPDMRVTTFDETLRHAPGATRPASGPALDAVLRDEDPDLFTWTGGLRSDVAAKHRSTMSRARLQAAWPDVPFTVRTASAKKTTVSWTNGPSVSCVDALLDDLYPGFGFSSDVKLHRVRHRTATATAVAQILLAEQHGRPYSTMRPKDRTELHQVFVDVSSQLFVGSHTHSALRVSEEQFDAAHELAPVLLALADSHHRPMPHSDSRGESAVREALAQAILAVGLDTLWSLAG